MASWLKNCCGDNPVACWLLAVSTWTALLWAPVAPVGKEVLVLLVSELSLEPCKDSTWVNKRSTRSAFLPDTDNLKCLRCDLSADTVNSANSGFETPDRL